MPRTTPAQVRDALDADANEYPSDEIDFEINVASRLVDRRCAPHTSDERALADTETYVAASLVVGGADGDPRLSSIEQESTRVSWDWDATADLAGPAASLWETAVMLDPSGRLDDPHTGEMWTVAYGPDADGGRR